jgi:hypothetical protein
MEETKKNIRRSMILALAALFAIICVCTAWFVSSRIAGADTTLEAMSIGFELASAGGEGQYDPLLRSDTLGEDAGWHIGESWATTGTTTTSELTQINWLMSTDSNLNNDSGNDDPGIYPGASGKLTFYVIPAQDGDLTVNFSITLSAFREAEESSDSSITVRRGDTDSETVIEEITSDGTDAAAPVLELMKGHILFFESFSGGRYSGLIENGSFSKTFEGAKNGEAQAVTVYWVWPYVVGQMLLPDNSASLGANHPLFTAEVRKKLCADMQENKQKYYYADELGTLDSSVTDDNIANVFSGAFLPSEYTAVSRYFNLADQEIGENARYVLLRLSAQT